MEDDLPRPRGFYHKRAVLSNPSRFPFNHGVKCSVSTRKPFSNPVFSPEDGFEVDLRLIGAMHKCPNLFGDAVTAGFSIDQSDMADELVDACDKLGYDQVDVSSAAILTSFSDISGTRLSRYIRRRPRKGVSQQRD